MIKSDYRDIVKQGYTKGSYLRAFRDGYSLSQLERAFLDRLIFGLSDRAKILDMGCGTGIPYDRYLGDKGFQITGIDFVGNHIEMAMENVPEGTYVECDFTKMNLNKASFSAIVSFYAVFHVPKEEHEYLLHQMDSLLESGGMILMTLGTQYGDSFKDDWCGTSMVWSSHAIDTYRRMFAQYYLDIVMEDFEGKPGDDEYHWWVLLRKRSSLSV